MRSDSRKHLLAEIAAMYYLDGRSQNEIANEFGYSRSAISRLLSEAEEKGVVEHKIHFPALRNIELEEKLTDQYRLSDVVVINRGKLSYSQALHFAGERGAEIFSRLIKDDQVIGLSTGTSVFQVINSLEPRTHENIKVVQIIGATGVKSDPAIDGPELAGSLSRKVQGSYYALNAPMLMDNKASRDTIISQRSIKSTIELSYQADIILAGIGCITEEPELESIVRMGYLEPKEFVAIRKQGAIGYTCGWFFNEEGDILVDQINDRVVAADYRRIRSGKAIVIAISIGARKAPAIQAALKGNLVDILITDSAAVESFI